MSCIYIVPGIFQVNLCMHFNVLLEQLYIMDLCHVGFSLISVHTIYAHRTLGACLVPLVFMQEASEVRHNLNIFKTTNPTYNEAEISRLRGHGFC